jgi:hypothetical protein
MIVGRISPDRRSILDFLYLDVVPKTKYNFRVTEEMLTHKPRGTAEEIAAAVLGGLLAGADCHSSLRA